MNATGRIARLTSREDGGIVLFIAMLMPVVLLFLALSVDVGNWWVHKRHLQLQADAAALAGGAVFGECFANPGGANAAIQNEAARFGGAGGSSYNGQVGGANTGTVTLRYQSTTYAAGSVGPDDTETQAPCDTPSLMFDVKASEGGLPLIFRLSGLSEVSAINAHARVQLRTVESQEGLLPLAVPDLRFNYIFATFVNEVTGASLGTVELQRNGTSGNDQLWSTPAGIPVSIASRDVGVRLRLVGGTNPNAPCGQLYTECYDAESTNGVVHIHGWTAGAAPAARNAWLLAGSCVPDAYFATGDCGGGVQAQIDLGADLPLVGTDVTARVWATVGGGGMYQLTRGGATGLVTWSALSGLPFTGSGPHTVGLEWDWEQTSGTWRGHTCNTRNNNPCQDEGIFGAVQRAFVAGETRSGPVQRVQVFESGVTTSGSNSFQTGSAPTLGVSIAVTGSLVIQSQAGDPVIELRVGGESGSLNQSVDCDPATPNLADEIEFGCGPAYKVNPSLACPGYNELWSLPQPWDCVKTQTGGAVGQVERGMRGRILGGANSCTAPINWPNYDLDDPRIVQLMITPFGSFGGSGNNIIPVIDFGAFYVTGWRGDPCPGADPAPQGSIAGHFIKYAAPNPRGTGETICDPDAITPCIPILTR